MLAAYSNRRNKNAIYDDDDDDDNDKIRRYFASLYCLPLRSLHRGCAGNNAKPKAEHHRGISERYRPARLFDIAPHHRADRRSSVEGASSDGVADEFVHRYALAG